MSEYEPICVYCTSKLTLGNGVKPIKMKSIGINKYKCDECSMVRDYGQSLGSICKEYFIDDMNQDGAVGEGEL